MKIKTTLIMLIFGLSLSGCLDLQNSPKQTIGTVLGAGGGALLGSQIGGGKGKLAGVAIGALAGAFLGGELGKSLDDVDRMKAASAQQSALEYNRTGVSARWTNPDTGNSGQVTPEKAYQTSGRTCRDYEHQVLVNGRTETLRGTACRQSDGSWRDAT
ncbi:MAG: RT0821/Lpp0805 family surface protein [Rhodospirillaceae bacterium]|jgi:surface antigen